MLSVFFTCSTCALVWLRNLGFGAFKQLAPDVLDSSHVHEMHLTCSQINSKWYHLCELGKVPLHLFWYKMLLQYVGRLFDLPNDRLVKQAFTHAQQQKTTWFQKLSSWLSDYGFQGLIANGTFSVSNAMTTLRDKWFNQVCQSDFTKVKCFIDNLFFDSDQMAEYLSTRPSPALFAFIKFRLGSHRLRVETDGWLPVKPPTGQRICRHCDMIAVENEQHFLFDCPLYPGIRQQHTILFGPDQGSIRLFLERNADQIPLVAHYIHLCFQARMSDESHLAPQPGL